MTVIDDYLAELPREQRAVLAKLRRTMRAFVPKAEECISYGMPAFRLGVVIGGFQPTSKGFSYYPFSGTTLRTLAKDLRDYSQTRSALHFRDPLPEALVRKLLRARIAEIDA